MLNEELMGKEAPAPVRISVSGCGCRCAMSMLQDIGLVAEPDGYSVYIGGNPYGKPVVGEKVAEGLPDDKVLPALEAILAVYSSQRGRMKYLHQVIKSIGSIPFAQAIEKSCAGQ
jgi:NAD(P)H-nitrite reductase large subunit